MRKTKDMVLRAVYFFFAGRPAYMFTKYTETFRIRSIYSYKSGNSYWLACLLIIFCPALNVA